MVAEGNIHHVRVTNEDFLAYFHSDKIFNTLIQILSQQTPILTSVPSQW